MPQSHNQLVLQSGQPIPCDNSLDIRDPEGWIAPSACHSPFCLSLGKQSPNKQAGCEGPQGGWDSTSMPSAGWAVRGDSPRAIESAEHRWPLPALSSLSSVSTAFLTIVMSALGQQSSSLLLAPQPGTGLKSPSTHQTHRPEALPPA